MAGNKKAEYHKKLLDPRWQQVRLKVLERDEWTCRECGAKDRTLHAHHSYYVWGNDPWEYPLESIVTLCDDCHSDEHANWGNVDIVSTLCANGFWSVYDRWYFASALMGDRPLTRREGAQLTRILEAVAWSMRHEVDGPTSIRSRISAIARTAPTMLPGEGSSCQEPEA